MLEVHYEKDQLEIAGKKYQFPQIIDDIQKNNDCFFIKLKLVLNSPVSTTEEECNVYAVNNQGDFLWQIQNVAPQTHPEFRCSPIVLMRIDEQGKLFVTDFSGRKFQVDVKTGKMNLIGVTK